MVEPGSDRVEALVAQLTLAEKASLLAGEDLWSTVAVPRVGIPKLQVTDGPSGARGPTLPGVPAATSLCVPCGSALGATWNPELVEAVGTALGMETRDKGCRVLLAPTVNLHRSPLGGRNFECYSEDPLLSGRAAAAFVRGAQRAGVATTVKHFVGNDAETERYTMSSFIDDRSLRELYLVPFEMAVRDGGSLGVMTGYNRLNGVWCGEHDQLLAGILRGDWGFDGFVVSDWYAIGSAVGSARAGLDLEMPGPARAYAGLEDAVARGDLDEATLDARVRTLLSVWDRLGALDDPMEPPAAQAVDRPEHRALARRAAIESMVLLRNDGAVLPFDMARLRRLALIGPNAAVLQVNGGGSAAVTPHHSTTLLDELRAALPGVDIVVEPGCDTEPNAPTITRQQLRTPGGEAGIAVEYFEGLELQGEPVSQRVARDCALLSWGAPRGVPAEFSFRATATFTSTESGAHTFALVQAGRARVLLDGALLLDGERRPPAPGREQFGMVSEPVERVVELRAGDPHDLVIEYRAVEPSLMCGVRVGCRPPATVDLFGRAVEAARGCDAALVVLGTDARWESEGHDRAAMDLPGGQRELAVAIAQVNERTAVVVNSGSIVAMEWADQVPAVVHAWFGGQEMAGALVDVVLGVADPSGRLPTTVPQRIEHTPAFGAFPGENSAVRYGEGLLVGYRWYDSRHLPVRFPFGHGMSYTTFALGQPELHTGDGEGGVFAAGGVVRIEVPVTNTGARRGSEVVQCYVAPREPSLGRPVHELKGFAKIELDPGESGQVTIELGDRAFAHYDDGDRAWPELRSRQAEFQPFAPLARRRHVEPGWYIDAGDYELRIGRSSRDLAHRALVRVDFETRINS